MTTVANKRKLGDILVEASVITPLELDEGMQRQRLTGDFLGRVLVKMELCQEQDIPPVLVPSVTACMSVSRLQSRGRAEA